MALASAAAAFARAATPLLLAHGGWTRAAEAASADVLRDTYNALLAFVVPGRDDYSLHQGVATAEPGGVESGAVDALIATIDESTPYFPGFSTVIAGILNDIALAISGTASGPFVSPFARLKMADKATVFQVMDADPSLKLIAGVLPAFVAFFAYSEAGVFDASTRELTAEPLGWTLSNYQGVADGRNEFLGYFGGK
jgi:hypothetical protein